MRHESEHGAPGGPQVLFGLDHSGVCTLSIGPGLERLGLRPNELVGRNLFEVYRDDPRAVDALRRVLDGELVDTEREFAGRRLSVHFQPMVEDDGTVTGAVGVATDVTEQRRIEAEVLAARERAALLGDLSEALDREVLDLGGLVRVTVRAVTEAVADRGTVWLRTDDARRTTPRASWPADEQVPRRAGPAMPAAEIPVRPVVLDRGHRPTLRVPLRARGLALGMLELVRGDDRGAFERGDVTLAGDLADRCALALDNAMLLDSQRRAREELMKFRALADASTDLVAITDTDDRVIYANPQVHEVGIVLGDERVWETIATYGGERLMTQIRTALATTGRWSGETPLAVPGERLLGHIEAFHLAHPDTGAALGTAWIGKDVTGLRAAESALRAANADLQQFKALVETSPDFIAIADLDGRVRYVNPHGREMVGLDPAVDVTGTAIADYLTPDGLAASERVEQPAVVTDGHWEGESTLRTREGTAIPVAIASFLMRDEETGEPYALATVQRDLTERLAAETALRDLAEQREALLTRLVDAQDAERTRIAADVHDDQVQALAAVDVRLGLLERQAGERAPELLEALAPVRAAVAGATERLRALLFDLEPPDLHHGLTGALRRAADELFDGTATRCRVDGDREPDLPEATLAVAYRIALEALTNVRRHAGAHRLDVTVTGGRSGLEVTVADDGVGLGAEPATSPPGHRGLLTMRDRAALAGGRCTVEGRPEGGTRVTLWLPGPTSMQ